MKPIREFVAGYTAADRHRIAVRWDTTRPFDEHRQFRRRITAAVFRDPAAAPRALLLDLLAAEAEFGGRDPALELAGLSGSPPAGGEGLRCSFCSKSQRQANKLVAGPTVYICDECVDICLDIIVDEGGKVAKPAMPPGFGAARCRLCGWSLSQRPDLEPDTLWFCGDCRGKVERAISGLTPGP